MEEKVKQVIYTNSIGVNASVFDVKVLINYISDNNEKKQAEKDNICEVVMSPQHAKAFLNVLEKTINTYEESFGEIKLNSLKEEGKK